MIEFVLVILAGTILSKGSSLFSNFKHIEFKGSIVDLSFLLKVRQVQLIPIIGNCISVIRSDGQSRIKLALNTIIELVGPISIITIYYQYDITFDFFFKSLWILIFLTLGGIDLNSSKLPNYIIFPLLLVLLFMSPFWNTIGYERQMFGYNQFIGSIINTGFISVGLLLFWMGIYYAYPDSIGGGDIKLIIVIGLFFGFSGALITMYLSIIAAAVFSIIKMMLTKKSSVAIPFGSVLSLASILVIVAEDKLQQVYQFIFLG